MRSKESKIDYMFMREADLPRIYIRKELLQEAVEEIGEMPIQKRLSFSEKHDLTIP